MKLFFVTFSILSLLFIVGCNQDQVDVHATKKEVEASTEKKATKEESTVEKKSDTIFVYVCGSVKRPDVYEVEADGRIVDAVKAAGGFLKDADKNAVNLAQSLTDGQQIYIPSVKEQSKSNNEYLQLWGIRSVWCKNQYGSRYVWIVLNKRCTGKWSIRYGITD